MASRIPKSELDVLAINLDIGNVVLKDGGDVDLEKEKKVRTGFGAGTVAKDGCSDAGDRTCDRGLGSGSWESSPQGRCPWRRHCENKSVSGKPMRGVEDANADAAGLT